MSSKNNPDLLPPHVEESRDLWVERVDDAKGLDSARLAAEAAPWEPRRAELSLRTIFYMIFRHRWKVIFSFIIISLLVVLYVAHVPDTFVSEALVMIRSDRSGVTLDPLAEGNSLIKTGQYGGSMSTEFAIITSRAIAEAVTDRLGVQTILNGGNKPVSPVRAALPESGWRSAVARAQELLMNGIDNILFLLKLDPPQLTPHERAVRVVMKGLEAEPSTRGSEIMLIKYHGLDPSHSQKILNAVLDAYTLRNIEVYKSNVSPEFFKQKAEEYNKLLQAKTDELESLQRSLQISSLGSEKELLLNQLSSLESQVMAMTVTISSNEARRETIQNLIAAKAKEPASSTQAPQSAPGVNQVDNQLTSRLIDLKLQEAEMASRLQPSHPEMEKLHSQITELERIIAERQAPIMTAEGKLINPATTDLGQQLQTLDLDHESNVAARAKLQDEITKVQRELEQMTRNERRIEQLTREKTQLEQDTTRYLNGQQIAEITEKLDQNRISNVRVIQAASMPVLSEKSVKKMVAILIFGCVGGLLFGLGLAVGLEMLDQSLKSPEDIEAALGLPVLASLPEYSSLKPVLKVIHS